MRIEKNIPVKQLCAQLSISQGAYSNIENGITDISISRIVQLSELLNVSYTELLPVEKVLNYYSSPNDQSTGIQNNNCSITNKDSEAYQTTITALKDEINYLREQNLILLKHK